MKTPTTVLVLLLLALAAPCLAQAPPMQPEFQVSQGTLYGQYAYGVAIDKTGRFVVTWSGYDETSTNYLAFGRLYDAAGAAEGGELALSPPGTTNQDEATVAKDASGRLVVVWDEGDDILARRFEADGTPIGATFPVDTTSSATEDPRVASDDSGNFVVVWTGAGATQDVVARLFNSAGVPVTGELVVNSYTTDTQRARGVAMSSSGFAVTWAGQGTGGPGVWARRFDAAGAPLSADTKVNEGFLLFAIADSSVAMSAAGQYVVVWGGFVPPGNEGVFGRRFDAAGAPVAGEFPISDPSTANQGGPRIASDRAGNFIVTWTHIGGDGDVGSIAGRRFDRFDSPASPPFVVNETTAGPQYSGVVALNDAASFVVAWNSPDNDYYGVFGRRSGIRAAPEIFADAPNGLRSPESPSAAAGNGVLEPGETAAITTGWVNETSGDVLMSGAASDLSGPAGATYTIDDNSATYGTVGPGLTGLCTDDCYTVTVSAPAVRPAPHWDAQLQEQQTNFTPKTWTLHVGESFPDVPTGNNFYRFIETLFHNGVTGGCAGGGYCPTNPVTRAQMAVFLLKSKFGSAHIPPPCTGTAFTDVPCTGGPFDPWIEELASLAITGGCGGGLYCPDNTVTRQQMAVFLLKALLGSTYVPPVCAGDFDDVPCPSQFADWIEDLYGRSITGGCSVSPPLYCPTNPNNRGQMAVFLTKTFGLVLYGP